MAAQRTENEDPELTLVPKTPETPISLPTSSAAAPPSRRFVSASSPARHPIRTAEDSDDVAQQRREVNRCSGCRRKVGLAGFRCRCGELFCSEHRYSDRHVCGYDYKAVGREAIARENPLVKAAKIIRI